MQKKILVVDCGSSKVPHIISLLTELDVQTEVVKLESLPGRIFENYSGVIISGAPILLTKTGAADFLKYSDQIKNTTTPVLGICFGHQLIGLHFNANVSLCPEDRSAQHIRKIIPGKILAGLTNEFIMKEDHTECINIPEGFHLAASSQVCENEAMEHKERPIFGVQFHPEVSGEEGKTVFRNFLEICQM